VRSPDGWQQPFLFLVGPPAPWPLGRAKPTDLLVEADQILTELPQTRKLGNLLLRLAKRGWVGKGFRYGLAGHSPSQAELRIMARIVGFGAMAGRLTAATDNGSNGTGPKIAQA